MRFKNGNIVYGIEPNDEMRIAAEKYLSKYSQFHTVKGISDSTTLNDQIADFIIAAQAFHWFEPTSTKIEFQRLLKKKSRILLMWNDRKMSGSKFAEEYEVLINKFGTDYKQVKHKNVDSNRIVDFLDHYGE